MRVMWVINHEIPLIANNKFVNEGWITGMLSAMKQYLSNIEIILVYPQNRCKTNIEMVVSNISTIGYYRKKSGVKFDKKLEFTFTSILTKLNPDVIHIMGSEFPHTYSMCLACEKLNLLDKLVISIQGLISECAKNYTLGIPNHVIHSYTLRDLLKGNINYDQNQFYNRGKYEILALQKAKHVIGRTEWDYACCKQINPKIQYHFNNEVLRDKFYSCRWNYETCNRHTIFISQGGYPIKGLHFVLKAISMIKEEYPDVLVKIAGHNILDNKWYRKNSYSKYITKLIIKYQLQENIKFLGLLPEEKIIQEYRKANVFVSPSIIENSSNSIGEAMLLGMPIISSDVGGVKTFIQHQKNGYLYPCCEPNMLAYYIGKMFSNIDEAIQMGETAQTDAVTIFDKQKNALELLHIYEETIAEHSLLKERKYK